MTYEEFLAALRKTPRDWRLSTLGIRCGHYPAQNCPISAVTGNLEHYGNPFDAGNRVLKMDAAEVNEIVAAADNWPSADPHIRRDLLAACGIKEDEG